MKLTKLLVTILILVMFTGQAYAEDITFRWLPPTSGAPVVHYAVQYTAGGGEWILTEHTPTKPEITLDFAYGIEYTIRVAGVDAQDRQGVWSEASDVVLLIEPAPGMCSKPWRVQ